MTALSTSGLKKEFWAKREIDPVFPCHGCRVCWLALTDWTRCHEEARIWLNSGHSLPKCPYLGNIFFTFFSNQLIVTDTQSALNLEKKQKDPIFPNPEPYSQKPFKRPHHLRTLHTFSKTFPNNFLSLQKGSTAVCSP